MVAMQYLMLHELLLEVVGDTRQCRVHVPRHTLVWPGEGNLGS